MSTITAIILTKNEQKTIVDTIESLSWCSEIIVVDDESKDNTIALAKRQNATVLEHPLNHNFAEQRNFAMEQAKGEWILFIDADEKVTDALRYEIQSVIHEVRPANGYIFSRKDILWGKQLEHGEVGSTTLLRLARKGKGKWIGKVHEVWKVTGRVEKCKNVLLHYPHQTIKEFLAEVNYYSSLRAQELFHKNVKSNWTSIILYPKAKFIINFIFRLGFKDGIPGLLVAIIMSFHSFLVRAKLWQLWHQEIY